MTSKIDFMVAPPGIVLKEIGERIAENRLQQNITQDELAQKSGVAVRTLRRLEAGNGGSMETLVRTLQALGHADSLDFLLPRIDISPMQAIKVARNKHARTNPRSRASKKRIKSATSWSWDERETP
tara:strand:+ start:499 stop:876 length:378 start_codon:yes stop_codon:yes gene_type:complete